MGKKEKREEKETKQEKVVYVLAFLTFREATNQQKMFVYLHSKCWTQQKKN